MHADRIRKPQGFCDLICPAHAVRATAEPHRQTNCASIRLHNHHITYQGPQVITSRLLTSCIYPGKCVRCEQIGYRLRDVLTVRADIDIVISPADSRWKRGKAHANLRYAQYSQAFRQFRFEPPR